MEDLELFFADLEPTDAEQVGVLVEAFRKFQEKNAKYRDLWKQGGWMDSAHHIRHKGARVAMLLTSDASLTEAETMEEDAIDLINYCAFFIRNIREARAKLQAQPVPEGATVKEGWTVIDKWWTDSPVKAEYRELELTDGTNRIEVRLDGYDEWREAKPKTKSGPVIDSLGDRHEDASKGRYS
jgi:hypothetical protein